MGNCLHIQSKKEKFSELEIEYSRSQSHFSITSQVERYMYMSHFDELVDYDEFKELINSK